MRIKNFCFILKEINDYAGNTTLISLSSLMQEP